MLSNKTDFVILNQVEIKRVTFFCESESQRMSQLLGLQPLYTGQSHSQFCLKNNSQNEWIQSSLLYVVSFTVILLISRISKGKINVW